MIEVKHLTKKYGSGVAVSDLSFKVESGKIYGFLGPNGAGKSTTMNIIAGCLAPTEGQVLIGGYDICEEPDEAKRLIGYLPEQPPLYPDMTPEEYLTFVGRAKGLRGAELHEEIEYVMDATCIGGMRNRLIKNLSKGYKQRVGIAQAMLGSPEIIILDEPTAVLTTQETVELFKELRNLKEQGYTIVFISHKLNEIMEITDRLTIMRGGRSMGVYNTCDVTKEEISRLMVGRDVILNVQKDKAQPTDVVLRVRDVEYVNEWHKKMLDKISFDVRRGEILGIAGVEGNGQKELVDMLFGFLTPNAGSVTVQEENILGLPQQKLRSKGISLVPEDRMLYGIAASASIEENLISDRSAEKRLNHGPLFNMKAIHEEADRLIEDYTVLCKSRKQQVGMLSGGNIQKVVVAREFSGDPVLILADQPTRGIDVGATEFIRKKLVELSRSGIAVLLISADLAEVMELSDSLIVMHGGKIAAYFEDTSTLTDDVMGEYMLGLKHQSDEEIRRVCHD